MTRPARPPGLALRASLRSVQNTFGPRRFSYATHQMLDGYDIRSVQEAMGHKDIRTTEVYLHVARAMRGELGSPLDRLKDGDRH